MVLLGLLLGLVGTDMNSVVIRFGFGMPELSDGLGFIVIAMGVFVTRGLSAILLVLAALLLLLLLLLVLLLLPGIKKKREASGRQTGSALELFEHLFMQVVAFGLRHEGVNAAIKTHRALVQQQQPVGDLDFFNQVGGP
jgi:TctA family transporter